MAETYFRATGEWRPTTTGRIVGYVDIVPVLSDGAVFHANFEDNLIGIVGPTPARGKLINGILHDYSDDLPGVKLLAQTEDLEFAEGDELFYRVDFHLSYAMPHSNIAVRIPMDSVYFPASTDATERDIVAYQFDAATMPIPLPSLPVSGLGDATNYAKGFLTGVSDSLEGRIYLNAERATQFNILEFGAVGNGIMDCTTNIQAAIDAAAAATGGGRVYIPPGIFRTTGILTIKSNVEVYGAGPQSAIRPDFPTTSPNRAIDNDWVNGSENITLRNFRLDRSYATKSHGILLTGVDGLLIDGLEISSDNVVTQAGAGALAVSGVGPATDLQSRNVRVVNCVFRQVGNYGVQAGYVDGMIIANNTAYDCFREVFGVEPEGASSAARNVVISGNEVFGSSIVNGSKTGVIVITTNSGGDIVGVTVNGNTIRQISGGLTDNPGIQVNGGEAIAITNNTIEGMDGPGIKIGIVGFDKTDHVVCTGNNVRNCSQQGAGLWPGILLREARWNLVEGNYVYGVNHTYSVDEQAACEDNMIACNYLFDTVPVNITHASTAVWGNKTVAGSKAFKVGYSGSTTPRIEIDGSASSTRRLAWMSAGVDRWNADVSGTESGSNAGGDLIFVARDDAGASIGATMTLQRRFKRINVNGSFALHRTAVSANYTVSSFDQLVAVTDTTAARTITLPNAVSLGAGAELIIKDESGGAATNNITVQIGTGGQTIDGVTSVVINRNYGVLALYSDGANWRVERPLAAALNASDNVFSGPVQINNAINLGHATDTTLARVAAGRITIEGAEVLTATAQAALTAKATPVDADTLTLWDSAASGAPKSLSISALKTLVYGYIVGAAPGTLDTLDELAAALGDDPAFATTVSTALSNRVDKTATANRIYGTDGAGAQTTYEVSALGASSSIALRDSGGNLAADAFIPGFTTQATAGGTTTLNSSSNEIQEFTGTLNQTCTMTSSAAIGRRFTIYNNSTGVITVNASGGTLIHTLPAGRSATYIARQTNPSVNTHWAVVGYHVDIDVLATLSPANDDFLQRKSGAWTNRTKAQVITDLVGAGLPYDISYLHSTGQRATGAGANTMGIRFARAVTLTSVTYRCATADASGNLVVELRRNGVAIATSAATIASGSQVAGSTVAFTQAFAVGDILTVHVTGVGTTPGTGLIADITGVTA